MLKKPPCSVYTRTHLELAIMALPPHQYCIQDKLKTPSPHHHSFKQLWETKWKHPAQMGVYPFMFSCSEDFEPIVEEMERKGMRRAIRLGCVCGHLLPAGVPLQYIELLGFQHHGLGIRSMLGPNARRIVPRR